MQSPRTGMSCIYMLLTVPLILEGNAGRDLRHFLWAGEGDGSTSIYWYQQGELIVKWHQPSASKLHLTIAHKYNCEFT